MRLKSDIWVKALIARAAGGGCPAVVVRRGDGDAGAIFVVVARLDGTSDLYGPAPAGLQSDDGERLFERLRAAAPDSLVSEHLTREARLDSDFWVVEIESREGRHFLDGWLSPEAPSTPKR